MLIFLKMECCEGDTISNWSKELYAMGLDLFAGVYLGT